MTPSEREELRRWLAVEVMGIEQILSPRQVTVDDYVILPDGSKLMIQLFKPDTDLNQAFMLVEKMRKKGWYLALFTYGEETEAFFSRGMPTPDEDSHFAADFNPALAICLAVKAAVTSSPHSSS